MANTVKPTTFFTRAQWLSLDESALHLIGNWLQEIAQDGPAAGLHENFRRHAGDELQSGQPATLVFGQRHADGEIGGVGLLVAADIGRDVGHKPPKLWRHALVEGRKARERLLANPNLVNIVGL